MVPHKSYRPHKYNRYYMLRDVMRTTIQVTEELRNALKELGKKGESYEDILWRLIKGDKGKK